MQYQHISSNTIRSAIFPHSWFILNLLLTHLFAFLIIMEIGTAAHALLIPIVSILILTLFWQIAKQKQKTDDWFIAAHWVHMTKRAKILIIAYAIGLTIGTLSWLVLPELKGQTGNLVPFFLTGVPIFFGILVTFVLSGTSIFDAQRMMVSDGVVKQFPPSAEWLAKHPLAASETQSAS